MSLAHRNWGRIHIQRCDLVTWPALSYADCRNIRYNDKSSKLLRFVICKHYISRVPARVSGDGGGMENRPIIKTLLAVSYRKTISYLHITSSKYYSCPGGCSNSSRLILGKSWLTSLLCPLPAFITVTLTAQQPSTIPISHAGGGCHD